MLEVDDNTTRAGGEGDKVPLLHLQRFIPLVNRWDLGRLFFRSIPFFFSPKESTNTKHTASYQKYCLLLEMCWKMNTDKWGCAMKGTRAPSCQVSVGKRLAEWGFPCSHFGKGRDFIMDAILRLQGCSHHEKFTRVWGVVITNTIFKY